MAVVSAGTSDLPVAGEAAATLSFLGHSVTRFSDIGVAGIHRLLSRIDEIRSAAVVIVGGVLAGIEWLEIGHLVVSPLPLGRGFIHGAHSQIPLPAPATISLLQGVPICGSLIDNELVTPTGAAPLTELADAWELLPAMPLRSAGYGAGSRDMVILNVVRILLVDSSPSGTSTPWKHATAPPP